MNEETKDKKSVFQCIRELGPGLLLASAAVGGSHIVSAMQAEANFGWQLLLLVILAVIVQLLVCALLVFGDYTALDKVTKAVMFVLTSATLPF